MPEKIGEKPTKGFTLIELLVVISVIGILAAFAIASFSSVQARGRDAQRKNDLTVIQKTLQLYYNDHNAYPIGGWISSEPDNAWTTYLGASWIPGLVPDYIDKLPTDPKAGPGVPSDICKPDIENWKQGYLYLSQSGKGYTLISHCAPEGSWDSSSGFYDCTRPTHAWKIYELDDAPGETVCGY